MSRRLVAVGVEKLGKSPNNKNSLAAWWVGNGLDLRKSLRFLFSFVLLCFFFLHCQSGWFFWENFNKVRENWKVLESKISDRTNRAWTNVEKVDRMVDLLFPNFLSFCFWITSESQLLQPIVSLYVLMSNGGEEIEMKKVMSWIIKRGRGPLELWFVWMWSSMSKREIACHLGFICFIA